MEFLLGLFTGYFLTWPGLIVLCIIGTFAESNEAHGVATFFGIVAAITAYFFFNVPFEIIGIYAIGYFVVGFIWSFWRYKRYADKIVAEYKDLSDSSKRMALAELDPKRMLGKITTWVIVWPFSMVENVLGDLIQIVQTTITTFFKGIYTRIYVSAVGQLMPTVTEEKSGS